MKYCLAILMIMLSFASVAKEEKSQGFKEFSAGCMDSVTKNINNGNLANVSLAQGQNYCDCTSEINYAAVTKEEWDEFQQRILSKKEQEVMSEKLRISSQKAHQMCKQHLTE